MKDILPRLIDTQQTGFVAGRNIIDNILSLRLGQEWAQVTNQNTIFVKLDFMKEYDRVAHGFLWDTLATVGMGEETVQRIKGLVVGGSSEIHINGDFMEEISIERGVRQGCPLAPLLFAMTTQPLMRTLREEEAQGNIQGLNIGDGKSLLHQLFADDTGICITAEEAQFDKLKEVIRDFEVASGASLNLQKSIVMQMRPGPPQMWMEDSGCEVAGPGKKFVYLGVSTSTPIDEKTIADEIVQKMLKKLKHWSNRLLSWPSKTILLRHVLAATPLYQLLSVGLSKDGLEALERLCRNFLWGWNEEGRILEGEDVEWIHLAQSFILRSLRRGSYQRECRQWTTREGLLLLPLTKIAGSPTLTRILSSWFRARRQLEWTGPSKELDGRMTMLQVKMMYQLAETNTLRLVKPVKELGVLRKAGICTLEEAMEVSRRIGWKAHLRNCCIFPEEDTLLRLEELEVWSRQQLLVRKDIMELDGWRWKTKPGVFQWYWSTKNWRQIMEKVVDFSETMEDKWRSQSQVLQWQQRWRYLWEALISYRRKVWLWRITQRGFFTNSRAAEMGHQDGSCKRCPEQSEVRQVCWCAFCIAGQHGEGGTSGSLVINM
ncbi:hypothetical protein R1sor_011447 [Riccia sorocarpa]|uniref:Reverse transcriptase domain-containing protein n=1 Tax=Riccia sorocarpa TaxID=122646 RepID=A0ABD3I218_9MARC